MRRRSPAAGLLTAVLALAALGCPARAPRGAGIEADGGPPDAASTAPVAIRVATFNVRRFFDTVCQSGSCAPGDYEALPTQQGFEARADQLASAIRGLEAQLVVLQEIETQACLDALTGRLADVLPNGVLGEIGAPASVDVAVLAAAPIDQALRHRDEPLVRPDGSTTLFSRELLEVRLRTAGAGRYRPGSARVLGANPGYGGSDHGALLADFDPGH